MRSKWTSTSRRDFCRTLGGIAAGTMAGSGSVSAFASPAQAAQGTLPNRPRPEIHVGSRRQLLFDDFFVATGFWTGAANHPYDIPYNIRWSVGPVEKADKILLASDQPWEGQTTWFCVLHDGGRYRLWYGATKPPDPAEFNCYAESDDGLTWRKPLINPGTQGESKSNKLIFEGSDAWDKALGNVFIDPTAKPEERYKMVYSAWENRHMYPNEHYPFAAEAGVFRGAYSSDGLSWKQYPEIFVGRFPDAQSSATYDPALGKYVAYIRSSCDYGGLDIGSPPVQSAVRGRSISRIESWNFHQWDAPQLALVPDFEDGLDVDFYDPIYARYEEADHAHLLFPGVYHHRSGRIAPQIAVSRDGKSWARSTRETFISLGPPGSFDSIMIRPSPGIVPLGNNQLALYYRANNVPHPGGLAKRETAGVNSMSRVVFKRDRFIGIEAGKEEGGFTTRPLLFDGRRLVLNVQPTGLDARVQVEMIGVGTVPGENKVHGKFMDDAVCPGYSMEDSIVISSDQLEATVRWKDRAEVGEWAGKPVRLRFRLQSTRIYAFQFVP